MGRKTKISKHRKNKIAKSSDSLVALRKDGDPNCELDNLAKNGKDGDPNLELNNPVNLGKDGDPKTSNEEDNVIRMKISPEMIDLVDEQVLQTLAEGTLEFLQTILCAKKCEEPLFTPIYDRETGQYFLGEEVHQEDDIVWIPLKPTFETDEEFYSVNADTLVHLPRTFDMRSVPKGLKDAYLKARFVAFGQEEPGYVIICHSGYFWLPCQNFLNPHTHEVDQIMCVYNAESCLSTHRHFYATVDVEIGHLGFQTNLRFRRGAEVDWGKRFWDEVDVIRRRLPTYDPFLDPYDPKNIYDNSGWQFGFWGE